MIRKVGILQFFLSPVLGIILFPIILLISLLNELARLTVKWILFVKYNGQIELTEGADGMYACKREGATKNEIVLMFAPEGSYSQEYVAKFYREQIQSYKNDRRYDKFEKIMMTCCGYSCWKKQKDFNVEDHIRVLDGNKIYSFEDVQECLNQFENDLPDEKPQWEVILMPKYDDGTGVIKSILFIQLLHAYMDALSLMLVFGDRGIINSMELVIDPLTFKIDWWKNIIMHFSSWIYGPFYLVVMNLERIFKLPWILRNCSSKEPRRKFYTWARSRITSQMIRKIRKYDGKASVSNVIATAFVLAARKVLPKERLDDELLIAEIAAKLPYPDSRPQNRMAFFTYAVSSAEERSYVKLQKVQRESVKSMLGPDILMSYYLLKFGGRFPSFVHSLFLRGSIGSVLLSNAPFSKTKATLPTGIPLLDFGAFTPQPSDLGLTLLVSRYCDEIKISSVADSTWLSQTELTKLVDQMPLEILQMAEEAGFVE